MEKYREKHIKKLREGVESWNDWRTECPNIRPILYELNNKDRRNDGINVHDLKDANFSNANLIEADLSSADLSNANFHEANLGGAKLRGSTLINTNFCRTDFYRTDLSGANLSGANLQGAQIAGTKFNKLNGEPAQLIDCKVYGSSAWHLEGIDKAKQEGLEIVYKPDEGNGYSKLMVNDLEMAQFLFFILNNKHLTDVFNSANSSLVLLLGSFHKKEKEVLDTLRKHIRDIKGKKYIPVIFDFKKPDNFDYTGVITVLAGMSKFIIADLTHAQSVPHELHAIVGAFSKPVIPIIKSYGEHKKPFSMFVDYYKYYWVHPVIEYSSSMFSEEQCDRLISEAERFSQKIEGIRKNTRIESVSIDSL